MASKKTSTVNGVKISGTLDSAMNYYGNMLNDPKKSAYAQNQMAKLMGSQSIQAPTFNPFTFDYNYLTQDQARANALAQLNPLYDQAIEGVKAQKYNDEVLSGSQAAARGLGQSGLAQDALNKIGIAAASNIKGLEGERASKAAALVQQMLESDRNYALQLRGQKYGEYSDNRDFQYGSYRDKVNDNQQKWQNSYQSYWDNKQFNYNAGRDKVNDAQWQKTYDRGVLESDRNFNLDKYKAYKSGGSGSSGTSTNFSDYYTDEPTGSGYTVDPNKVKTEMQMYRDGVKRPLTEKDHQKYYGTKLNPYYK